MIERSYRFSIWNTILGSSLLTMPWGVAMAGLIPGIGLMLAMGALCLYTAYRLLQVHKYQGPSFIAFLLLFFFLYESLNEKGISDLNCK